MHKALKPLGFTLIEVIIASAVLLSALGFAITLVGSASLQIGNNQHRLTAVYLMQECLELTRNVRDSASGQNIWHCPFFSAEDAEVLTPDEELFLTIEPSEPLLTRAGANCQQDYGATITPVGSVDDGTRIDIGPQTYRQSLTIENVQTTLKTDVNGREYRAAEALTATCRVNWDFRGREYGVEGASVLTNWQRL